MVNALKNSSSGQSNYFLGGQPIHLFSTEDLQNSEISSQGTDKSARAGLIEAIKNRLSPEQAHPFAVFDQSLLVKIERGGIEDYYAALPPASIVGLLQELRGTGTAAKWPRGEAERTYPVYIHGMLMGHGTSQIIEELGRRGIQRSEDAVGKAVAKIKEELGLPKQIDLGVNLATKLQARLQGIATLAASEMWPELREYRRLFLPETAYVQILPHPRGGPSIPKISVGPSQGEPIVVLHAMALPHIGTLEEELLRELNLRLIFPLRNGALANNAPYMSEQEHLEHALTGISEVAKELSGRRFHLAALVTSSPIAVEFALRNPNLISGLSLIGACFVEGRPTKDARGLSDALIEVLQAGVMRWPAASRIAMEEMLSPNKFDAFISRHYRDCPSDLAVVEKEQTLALRRQRKINGTKGESEDTSTYNRLRFALANSLISVRHDFLHQKDDHWNDAARLDAPLHFYHGTDDQIHPVQSIIALSKSLRHASFHPIEKGGQLLYFEHFQPILRGIANSLRK